MNLVKKTLAILIVFALGFVLFKTFFSRIIPKPIVENNRFTDTDFNLTLEDNKTLKISKLKDYKGQVLFINFFATWCPPCREEMPSLQTLYNTKKDKAQFVFLAMDDTAEPVQNFISKNNYLLPVYQPKSAISDNILPSGLPTTYIISKSGKIIRHEVGGMDWNIPEIHQLLDSLSNAKD